MTRISRAKVQRLLASGDGASSTTEKGRVLEEAVNYVFSSVPGLRLHGKNAVTHFGTDEIDLFYYNKVVQSEWDFLEFCLIVECKNLARPVGSEDVSFFRARLLDRGCRSGVLVAAGGISGSPGTHAFHAVELSLSQGVQILVLTRSELEGLRSTEELTGLLLQKSLDLKQTGTLSVYA